MIYKYIKERIKKMQETITTNNMFQQSEKKLIK